MPRCLAVFSAGSACQNQYAKSPALCLRVVKMSASVTIRTGSKPVHAVHRRTLMTVAATMLLAGCEGMKQKDQASRLDQSLRAYAGAIRWGNFDTAAAFAVPRGGANTVNPASLDGTKVTGYVVRINSVNADADEASVHLSFTYYDETRATVGTINQDAMWYLDEKRKSWLMDGSLPRFKR